MLGRVASFVSNAIRKYSASGALRKVQVTRVVVVEEDSSWLTIVAGVVSVRRAVAG